MFFHYIDSTRINCVSQSGGNMKQLNLFNAICLLTSIAFSLSTAQSPVFHESNGLVVVEVEAVPPGEGWVLRQGSYALQGSNTVEGYTGDGCYHFTLNQESNGPATGTMEYSIKITNAGSYRLYMRGMEAPIETGEGDKANDCYVAMVGQDGCLGTLTKFVRLGNSFVWTYDIRSECSHHTFSDPVYDLSAGIHTFQIAGRSKNFLIDRFVLIDATKSSANPKDIALAPSATDSSDVIINPGTDPVGIESPAPGTILVMGSTVTLSGTGENLVWSYDANSDGEGEIAIGSGNDISFAVPTGIAGPKELTLMLTGDGGSTQVTYNLGDSDNPVRFGLTPKRLAETKASATYGIDGRRVQASAELPSAQRGLVVVPDKGEASLLVNVETD